VRDLPRPSVTRFARVGHVLPLKLRIGMAFSAAIATAVLVGACGSGVPGNAVAVIGSKPITIAAFNHWIVVANDSEQATNGTAAPPLPVPPNYTACVAGLRTSAEASTSTKTLKSECKQQYEGLNQEVIAYLAEAMWVEGEAVNRGVKVTAKQLHKAYLQQLKISKPPLTTKKALDTFLAKSGQTIQDLKWRTYVNMLDNAIVLQIQKQTSKVSKAAIAAYYKKNHSSFVTPASVDLHLIETSSEATATKVRGLLAGGESYATLAPKYSIDPTTKSTGGKEEGVRAGALTPLLNAAVFAAKVGVLSQPIQTPFGYYVFIVDSKTPQKVLSLKAASPQIKTTIAAKQENKAEQALASSFTKTWIARTTCASGYIWSGYCSNAPKTSSTSSTTSTPTVTTPSTGSTGATG
jgi:foldase protein PrsA